MPSSETAAPSRPSRERALDLAGVMVATGERVDMQALAAMLGVGRTTLYRWVGDREQVIAHVLIRGAEDLWAAGLEHRTADPLGTVLGVVGSFLASTGASPPLRTLVLQEPQVALRVLLDADGALVRWLRARVRHLVFGLVPETPASGQAVDDSVSVAVSLLWSAVAAGVDPDLAMVMRVLRTIAAPVPRPRLTPGGQSSPGGPGPRGRHISAICSACASLVRR